MASPDYRVRRATLDDIGPLTALWQSMNFPVEELARRITEFQVAESEDGKLVGAVGLQIAERQGLIHSEAFVDFSLADWVRPQFWERLNSLANNHGLLRLWTQETAPFWGQCGLTKAEGETAEKLPVLWCGSSAGWRTLKLREDCEEVLSADKEFALFMASEKQRTLRVHQQARLFKTVATIIALGVLILVIIGAVSLLHKNPQLLHR